MGCTRQGQGCLQKNFHTHFCRAFVGGADLARFTLALRTVSPGLNSWSWGYRAVTSRALESPRFSVDATDCQRGSTRRPVLCKSFSMCAVGSLRWQLIADESEVVRWVITPGHAALVVSGDGSRRTNERQVLECFTKTPLPDSSKVGQPPRKRFSTLQLFVSVQEPPLGDSTPRTKKLAQTHDPKWPPL